MTKSSTEFIKFALAYAARSLMINRRRSLLTIFTVMLSVTVSIIANRYSAAIMTLWEDGATSTGIGHAQVHARGYWEKPDGMDPSLLLVDGHPAEAAIVADANVESVSRRLEFEGIISGKGKTVYFLGVAVNPEDEIRVSPKIFSSRDQGKFVSSEDVSGITIGKGLSETLGLTIGDEATLLAQTLEGSSNGVSVIIRGIVDLPIPALSKRVIYVHRAHAQDVLRAEGKYSELGIRLKPTVDADAWVFAMKPEIKALSADLRGWWEIDKIIRNVQKIWASIIGVIAFLLFVSAGISVLNIIFMVVAERTIEIGTLMAIGAKGSDIRRLFTCEALIIGIVGGLGGVVVGNAAVLFMGLSGVPFDSPFSSGFITVYPTVNLSETVLVMIGAIVICLFAAFFPARKAANVEPVRAFKGQVV